MSANVRTEALRGVRGLYRRSAIREGEYYHTTVTVESFSRLLLPSARPSKLRATSKMLALLRVKRFPQDRTETAKDSERGLKRIREPGNKGEILPRE